MGQLRECFPGLKDTGHVFCRQREDEQSKERRRIARREERQVKTEAEANEEMMDSSPSSQLVAVAVIAER